MTKGALETLVGAWAEETEKTGLRVNIVSPGAMRTGMRAAAFPGEDPETLNRPRRDRVRLLNPTRSAYGGEPMKGDIASWSP